MTQTVFVYEGVEGTHGSHLLTHTARYHSARGEEGGWHERGPPSARGPLRPRPRKKVLSVISHKCRFKAFFFVVVVAVVVVVVSAVVLGVHTGTDVPESGLRTFFCRKNVFDGNRKFFLRGAKILIVAKEKFFRYSHLSRKLLIEKTFI